MTMRGSSFVKGNLVEGLQSNSHLSLMVKRSFQMRLSKKLMVGAGMAAVLTLPFSHAAMSAPTDPVSSANATIGSRLHQGDLVKLRSGGPLMTVDVVKGDQVECVWTDLNNGQPDDATFPADMLQKY
jgi:uncharacterized protein YodC (DUF2158 family)